MAGTGDRKTPLVADRRYTPERAKKPEPKPAPKSKAKPARKRRPARAGSGGGNVVFRLIAGIVRFFWRLIWGIGWRVGLFVALGLFGISYYYYAQLPDYAALIDARARGSVTLLDREGKVFAWRGETFGGQIDVDTVSPYLRDAVIATEDKRFYGHFGISPRGIASAIRINLSEGRGPFEGNGGSTITQQLAKLLCLGVAYNPKQRKTEAEYEEDCRSGGIKRKLKEIPFSMALEAKYGKAGVLSLYLNRAYLGAGARGFEAAAQRYFGKSAANVTPAEAAMLAGLLKAPSYYAPTNDLDRSRERAAVILSLMHDQDYLTDAEYQEARDNPAQLSKAARQKAGGYFADWVMETGPAFLTKDTTEDVIIETTLDQAIQKDAEDALNTVFSTKLKAGSKAQAAIVVMSADGAVRAMVGGRDISGPGSFNRATQALRQTGSTFKPFVYAAALDLGYDMNTIVDDSPVCLYVAGSGDWCPKNYDPDFRGLIPMYVALANSINTATVRVSQMAGLDAVRQVATQFGFASKLADGPAMALGVSESTLIEMTGAYAGILNGGSSVKPYGLIELRFQGEAEPFLGQEGGIGERVISEDAARQLTYMMTQVVEQGTGRRARLDGWDVAGKTGTTQAARDAWFIGFTADYVVGVWMGYDNNEPLTGVTGGGLPAEIWHEVMMRVTEGMEPRPLSVLRPEELAPSGQVMTGTGEPVPTAPSYPGQIFDATGGGQVAPAQPQEPQTIGDILRGILGGN